MLIINKLTGLHHDEVSKILHHLRTRYNLLSFVYFMNLQFLNS